MPKRALSYQHLPRAGADNYTERRAAMERISRHDAARLNAVAEAVTRIQGFTLFGDRYAIAVLALEALEEIERNTNPSPPDSGASS